MFARGLAILLLSCVAAPAASAAPLQPTDKWVVNYDDSQCNAYRNYGTEKNPLYLAFKAPPVGEVVQLMVVQNGPRMVPEQRDINVKVGDRKLLATNMLVYRSRKSEFRTKLINLPRAEFDALRQADKVVITGTGQDYAFGLSDMGPFMKALDKCVVDLREFYNVGVPGVPNPKLSAGPEGDLQRLFSGKDYPGNALIKLQGGTTSLEYSSTIRARLRTAPSRVRAALRRSTRRAAQSSPIAPGSSPRSTRRGNRPAPASPRRLPGGSQASRWPSRIPSNMSGVSPGSAANQAAQQGRRICADLG